MSESRTYKLAFSDYWPNRLKRHLLFWLLVWLYHVMRIGIMIPPFRDVHDVLSFLELTLFWGVLINAVTSYSIIYLLVPRFLPRRQYVKLVLGIIVVFLFVEALGVFHTFLLIGKSISDAIGYSSGWEWFLTIRPGFIRLLGNPPLICGFLLSLRMMKNWYLEQVRNETLARENASAELQLLKAQVHPHFLFNTLNNIYSFSLNRSAKARELIAKLNDLLGYMVNECNGPAVPLRNELKLIHDYITLEQVRYGSRLEMDLDIKGDAGNKMIAPLLLIPFVENSFKHGASKMLINPWVKLRIHINGDELDFELSNNQPGGSRRDNHFGGIGLQNVRKRLQLIYPDRYHLDVHAGEDEFQVRLRLHLAGGELQESVQASSIFQVSEISV